MLHDHESERMILASMMQDEYSLTESISSLTNDDFHNDLHNTLYQVLVSLFERGVKPTYFEVVKELKLGMVDLDKLSEISKAYIKGKNIHYWIAKVKSLSKLRKLDRVLKEGLTKLKNKPSDDLVEEIENEVFKLTYEDRIDNVLTGKEIASQAIDKIEEIKKNKGKIEGLRTGIPRLDIALRGMMPGNLILLGARTGEGKTALSLNIARTVAIAENKPMLYMNTEMSDLQLQLRLTSMLSGIPIRSIQAGQAKDEDFVKITQSLDGLYHSQLYFYNCPNLTMQKMISVARKFKAQKNIEFLVIDYIGRMEKIGQGMEEWQMLEKIVRSAKILAQNLKIPVLGIVQLNEDLRLQAAKRMENEADAFLKFYPLEEEMDLNFDPPPSHCIFVKKNRDGESGVKVPVYYDKEIQVVSGCERL